MNVRHHLPTVPLDSESRSMRAAVRPESIAVLCPGEYRF